MSFIDLKLHAKNESMDEYLASPAMSASKCKAFLRSPKHFKAEFIDGFKKKSAALEFGDICHAAILEPSRFLKYVIVEPEFTGLTKDGKESKQSGEAREKKKVWYEALAPENIIVTAQQQIDLIGIINSVKEHDVAREKLEKGIPEHSFYFTDPVTKLPCKFRPDFLTEDGWILDIKTTTDARNKIFMRSVDKYEYNISAAFSTMGFREIFGQDPRGYVFIAVEKECPWDCGVHVADAFVLETGKDSIAKAMALAKRCFEENRFPGCQEGQAENISMPPWRSFEWTMDS